MANLDVTYIFYHRPGASPTLSAPETEGAARHLHAVFTFKRGVVASL